ncbi:serine/threonine protein kinase, partial [Crocinitomicaceae bacterium]|nr:serine/threonine protein kinase [Crocinitomicaceae bacterium]
MINERIDEFTFLSKIGEGGMATVYKAFDNNFADHVAVKVLKKEYVFNKNVRARFISEARKLHKLSHPNIIGVRRIIDAGDICAFAMDMVNGQTLKEYVSRNKSLKNTEIKDFTNKMLNALDFVHSKGFVHRDIKPSNFMITEDQNVLLLDFGIAKDTNSESDYTATGTTHQMGTPSYMSPEQIKSTKAVDHRSDIYSLGVVIYYMVNGAGPYEGKELSLFELYEKIVNTDLKISNSKFDVVIKEATKKDVNMRIQNCELFRLSLIDASANTSRRNNQRINYRYYNY